MKQFLLLILAMVSASHSMAQLTFESPHVNDGKTLQLTIPKGYHTVTNENELGIAMYTTVEDLDMDANEEEILEAGVIFLLHMPTEGETLNSMKEMMVEKMEDENENMVITQTPTIEDINGRSSMLAGFKGNFLDDLVGTTYFGVIQFGDYFILQTYYGSDLIKDRMEFEDFKGILSSWKEVETSKEDLLKEAMEEEEYSSYVDEEDYEDYSIYYPNDLFETKITYYDILPDFGGDWNDDIDDSGHLLSMFSYKEENGFIKVFSGGSASSYPSEEEMASAIGQVMNSKKSLTLKFNSQFSNEDHVFKLYTIKGGETMSSVYTTIVGDELVFFVVDGGSSPVDDFKPAVRDFMLTMWVDYFEEED